MVFIVAAAGGMVFLGLTKGREALAARSAQLEQLTHLLLRAQEEERRRIARDLHDEAGQLLTALKIELDLDGKPGSRPTLVGAGPQPGPGHRQSAAALDPRRFRTGAVASEPGR